jgi:hypothetical protein
MDDCLHADSRCVVRHAGAGHDDYHYVFGPVDYHAAVKLMHQRIVDGTVSGSSWQYRDVPGTPPSCGSSHWFNPGIAHHLVNKPRSPPCVLCARQTKGTFTDGLNMQSGQTDCRQFRGLPGLVIANPLKVYVACTPIRGLPAAFLYDLPFCVLDRYPGNLFTLAPVTDPGSFIIHCSPSTGFNTSRIITRCLQTMH